MKEVPTFQEELYWLTLHVYTVGEASRTKETNTSGYKISKPEVGFRFSKIKRGQSEFDFIANIVQTFVPSAHAELPNSFISDFPYMVTQTANARYDYLILETDCFPFCNGPVKVTRKIM